MSVRATLLGTALSAGSLIGIDHYACEVLTTEPQALPRCSSEQICPFPGKVLEIYVSTTSHENIHHPDITKAEVMLLGISAVSAAAGSLILFREACMQFAKSLHEARPTAN